MLGLALRLCGGDRASAEDIVQETWLRAVDRAAQFAEGRSLTHWLAGFVVNCWREHERVGARERLSTPEEIEARSVDPVPIWSESPILERAVAALSDGYRAVIVLHDVEGFSHAEIAELLGIHEGTSKSQLARARQQLRTRLGAERPEIERRTGSDDVTR